VLFLSWLFFFFFFEAENIFYFDNGDAVHKVMQRTGSTTPK